jgi:hypothetical protein
MSTPFRRGDRVQIKLNSSYRHYLDGLLGTVTAVLHHGVIVQLDNAPQAQQRVIGPGGAAGPANPPPQQTVLQFHEVVKLNP